MQSDEPVGTTGKPKIENQNLQGKDTSPRANKV